MQHRVYTYNKFIRVGTPIIALLLIAIVYFYVWPKLDGYFDIADVYNANWNTTSLVLVTEVNDLPVDTSGFTPALILTADDDFTDTRRFCSGYFDLKKRELTPWARIDEIVVTVHDYQPRTIKGTFVPQVLFGAVDCYTYIVEIDAKKGTFSTQNRYEQTNGKRIKTRPSVIFLDKDHSDPFSVTINAKQQGLYTISCDVVVSHADRKQTIPVLEKKKFYFAK